MLNDNRDVKPLVRNVLDYIQLNLCSELSSEKLCNLFSTNRSTLSNEFKNAIGTTITNYVMGAKLELVKYALAFTELSMDEIAVKYGFKNIAYFSKMFKTKELVSPLKYRQRMKAGRKDNH